ncbi:vacuolar protein sorting-associated protein 37A-like [Rhagoletis pomonella]|uniref:vacuolar protein sorting-associated protein 37A-like n=1 Tax=Rhagoletis pomonella TaxID=28610 RepID=UPI0017831B71|nr:vacuolar protein sorting-associated protein 37A-like [Rhagoletis pomonella]XP_036339531.1 vacuolar protein sorting-associated protein 37A-like [Rhagoletis pomonella]
MLPRQPGAQQQQSKSSNLDFRKRQIDTLKIFNDNVVEVAEQEEYCIHFESGGRTLLLTVQLGANFPNERPKLVISPTVQHHWVNAVTGEVETAPGLLNYSPHSDLGRVVQAVIREYERFPPPVASSGSPINIPTRSGNINTTATPTTVAAKSLDSSKENSPLDSAKSSKTNDSSLPNLSTLSLDELKQLDSDPQFFDDFIEEMSVVQHLNEELDSMINQVEIISRENESKETHLVELKRKLSDDVTALKHLGEKCDQLNKKYLKKSEEYAPQHIRELLQIAASNADSDCDRHVEQFLNGKIDVQTFLNNYTHSKKVSAERKAKEERLGHQLSALERAGI